MQKIPVFFILIFWVSGMFNCNTHLSQSGNEGNKVVIEKKLTAINDYCEEWERIYGLLSEEKKRTLQKEGVVFSSDDKYEDAYYVLSSELLSDCEQRVKVGQFIWLVVIGRDTEKEKTFAAQNSKEIVKVLRHIWDSPAFSRDGTHHEKYSLLGYEGIKDEDMSLLIADLLKTKVFNLGLLNTLIWHPLPSLKPVISDLLKQSESKGELPEQIFYLIILQQSSPEPIFLSKLNKLSQNNKLSSETRVALKEIIDKFKAGNKIESEDLEKLQLPIDEFEENKNPKL